MSTTITQARTASADLKRLAKDLAQQDLRNHESEDFEALQGLLLTTAHDLLLLHNDLSERRGGKKYQVQEYAHV